MAATVYLVCSTGKITCNAFWIFYKTSRGSFVPVVFVHPVICQKSSVINGTGKFFVENVSSVIVLLW